MSPAFFQINTVPSVGLEIIVGTRQALLSLCFEYKGRESCNVMYHNNVLWDAGNMRMQRLT